VPQGLVERAPFDLLAKSVMDKVMDKAKRDPQGLVERQGLAERQDLVERDAHGITERTA
jgi:hypothetical protein